MTPGSQAAQPTAESDTPIAVWCPHEGCGQSFDSLRGMKIHHSMVHGGPLKDHVCSYCGEGFSAPRSDNRVYCSEECSEWDLTSVGPFDARIPEDPTITGSPLSGTAGPYNSYTQFGEFHNVHAEFIPFSHRAIDIVAVLKNIREWLDSRPQTRQLVTENALEAEFGSPIRSGILREYLEVYLLVLGWRRVDTGAAGGHYANPDYRHGHAGYRVTDRDERRKWTRRLARYGLHASILADIFGLSGKKATDNAPVIVSRLGLSWGDLRREGTVTMARTWKMLHYEWGYSYGELSDAFGHPPSTIKDRVHRFADDFTPPSDPTIGYVRKGYDGEIITLGGDR